MRITNKIKEKCISAILEFMKISEVSTRNEIIEGALLCYGLTPKEIENTNPRSKGGLVRSYIGTAFNDLLNKKDIIRYNDGYVLAKEELVIVKEDQCETQILKLLHSKSYTKSELYTELDKHFGTNLTTSTRDDNDLRSLAGNVLMNLLESNRVEFAGGRYCEKRYLTVDDADNVPLPEEQFKEKLYKRLWHMGGKNFESFCANVLEKYFSMTGQFVIFCDITGGSDDGGIDIVLETIDGLGFYEKIMVQTKCRDRAQINEKEIREFYGALNALGGSRGLYITTTSYHYGAKKLLDSIDNCVGIDGDKLFELIKKTEYGICKTKSGYTFDTALFSR